MSDFKSLPEYRLSDLDKRMIEEINDLNRRVVKRIQADVARAKGDMQVVWPYLLDRGWYLSPALKWGAESHLRKLVDANDNNEIDRLLIQAASDRIPELPAAVATNFQHRRRLIERAVAAHQTKDYVVSIPLLISQADGICFEVLGVSFTSRKNLESPKVKIADKLKAKSLGSTTHEQTAIAEAFLDGLNHYCNVSEKTSDRDAKRAADPSYFPLNRHGVQHGLDTDYDSEKNSLQAALMVDFMASVVDFL